MNAVDWPPKCTPQKKVPFNLRPRPWVLPPVILFRHMLVTKWHYLAGLHRWITPSSPLLRRTTKM